jgi:hypothetical protein
VPTRRLLGSFVLRVAIDGGRRTIVLYSVLTGESVRFDEFGALARYLERTTVHSSAGFEAPGQASGGSAEP